MKYLLLVLISFHIFAADINEKNIYHLHQSIGYMEEYSDGRCPNGLQRATNHLSSIKKPTKLLKPIIQGVKIALKKGKSVTKSDAESLRFHIQGVIDKTIKKHPDSWHKEFRACL